MTLLEYPGIGEFLEAMRLAEDKFQGLQHADLSEVKIDFMNKTGCLVELGSKDRLSKFLLEKSEETAAATAESGAELSNPIRLADLYRYARLESTEADPELVLVLPMEKLGARAFLQLVRELSHFRGYDYTFLDVQGRSGGQVFKAVQLARKRDVAPDQLPRTIAGAEILVMRNYHAAGWHCFPVGYRHPVLDDFPWLVTGQEFQGKITVWGHDRETRQFSHGTVEPGSGTHLSSVIEWTPFRGEYQIESVPVSETTPVQVQVRPVLRGRGSSSIKQRGMDIVICHVADGQGRVPRELLDRLDEAESGSLGDATYYAFRRTAAAFGPVSHCVRVPDADESMLRASISATLFIRPEIFYRFEIPVFLQDGFAFSPNIERLLAYVDGDHELIKELKEEFPQDGDVIYLLEGSDEGASAVCRTLRGAVPLADRIGSIVYQGSRQLEKEELEGIKQELDSQRDQAVEHLNLVATQESEHLNNMIDGVISAMEEVTGEAANRLQEIATQVHAVQRRTVAFKSRAEDGQSRWNEILKSINALLDKIVLPRDSWIDQADQRLGSLQEGAEKRKEMMISLREVVGSRLEEIEKITSEAESAVKQLDAALKKVTGFEQRTKDLAAQGRSVLNSVQQGLVAARSHLDREESSFQEEREKLVREQSVVEARRSQLQSNQEVQERQRNALATEREKLDAMAARLEQAAGEIKAEEVHLKNLRDHVIPRKSAEVKSLDDSLADLRGENLERKEAKLSDSVAVKQRQLEGLNREKARVLQLINQEQESVQALKQEQAEVDEQSKKLRRLEISNNSSRSQLQELVDGMGPRKRRAEKDKEMIRRKIKDIARDVNLELKDRSTGLFGMFRKKKND